MKNIQVLLSFNSKGVETCGILYLLKGLIDSCKQLATIVPIWQKRTIKIAPPQNNEAYRVYYGDPSFPV